MTPTRIQRSRAKGYKQPANTHYCGRPTKWGNPWTAEIAGGLTQALANYRFYLLHGDGQALLCQIEELRSYEHLSCFCRLDQPCHVDILIELLKETENTK